MDEGDEPDRRHTNEDHSSYTGDITITDHGEFVGHDKVGRDQYRVRGDIYQTAHPEYETDAADHWSQAFNAIAGLLQKLGKDTLASIYNQIDALPFWPALMVYTAALAGVSFLDLLQMLSFSIGLYYPVIVLPLAALMLPLLFKIMYEEHTCPRCGPFTLRQQEKNIVDTSRMRVFYRCTECGSTFREEMRTTEEQN